MPNQKRAKKPEKMCSLFFANVKEKVINEHERTMLSTMRTIELHCTNAETKCIGSTGKISAIRKRYVVKHNLTTEVYLMTVMETTTCFGLYWPSSGCLGNLWASYVHARARGIEISTYA